MFFNIDRRPWSWTSSSLALISLISLLMMCWVSSWMIISTGLI